MEEKIFPKWMHSSMSDWTNMEEGGFWWYYETEIIKFIKSKFVLLGGKQLRSDNSLDVFISFSKVITGTFVATAQLSS